MKIRHIIILLASALCMLWCNTAEAKKIRPTRAIAAPAFSTDWTNADSLRFYYHTKLAAGDTIMAFRIADSLMFHHLTQFDSVYNYLEQKTNWQARHFQNAMAAATLDSVASKFEKKGLAENVLAHVHLKLAALYAQTKMFEKAHAQQLMAIPYLIKTETDFASQSMALEAAEKEKGKIDIELKNEKEKSVRNLTIFGIAGLVLLGSLIFLILRLLKVRNKQKNLDDQIAHTRNQMEKSMEEEESTKREIKYLKEQMSRVEFENNQLKKNIKESTTETLPLLRSQLDGIVKESQDAIPVEKYIHLQNTITRFNKQMREATGDSQ